MILIETQKICHKKYAIIGYKKQLKYPLCRKSYPNRKTSKNQTSCKGRAEKLRLSAPSHTQDLICNQESVRVNESLLNKQASSIRERETASE